MEDLILLRQQYLQVINKFSIKTPVSFITEVEKILKFIWNLKGCWIINLEKKINKNEIGVTILNLTTYYKANEMKTVEWHKNRFRDQ